MFNIDHIGIAVSDLAPAVSRWCEMLDVRESEVEYRTVEHARMDMALIPGVRAKIELMRPWDEDSTIHKFIAKRGEGVHHICFTTRAIADLWRDFKDAGYALVDENPRESMDETIGFLHPKGFNGVLIEWKES